MSIDIIGIAQSLGIGGFALILFYLYAKHNAKQMMNLFNSQQKILERIDKTLERLEQTLNLHNQLLLNIVTKKVERKNVKKANSNVQA